jgi:O-acetyl-ADP-ribose deacetylase (regulator of RNase III)
MTLIHKTGNLFDSDADALAHGVNTKGLMGAGIAVEFKHRYPNMYTAYKVACKEGEIKPGILWVWDQQISLRIQGCLRKPSKAPKPEQPRWIYNIASQDNPGPHARLVWFESALLYSIAHAKEYGVKKIAMPRIGCGIGGLRWDDVLDIIEYYAGETDVDLEVWSQ